MKDKASTPINKTNVLIQAPGGIGGGIRGGFNTPSAVLCTFDLYQLFKPKRWGLALLACALKRCSSPLESFFISTEFNMIHS